MKELIVHLEFAKILGISSIISMVLTLITYLVFKGNRSIKYIPGLLLIIIGMYNLFYLGGEASTIDGVNKLFIVLIGMISGFIGLSTGLIIGVFTKGKD